MLTIDALRSAGLPNPITVARDGQEALDYLFSDRNSAVAPLLVLLDLKLPKVGGLEVLRRIRADERTRRLPVVVLTSSSEQEDINSSYWHGANSYIRKPVDFDGFVEASRLLGMYWIGVNEPPV